MQLNKIVTDESLMELARHGADDYPFQYYYEDIKKYDIGSIDWHWHREFEFVSVEKGEVHCSIGNAKIILKEGEGIFINAGVIHSFETPDRGIIPNILFSPEFIAGEKTLIYRKFVEPFIAEDISYLVLRKHIPWQTLILTKLCRIYQLCSDLSQAWEIEVHSVLGDIWTSLARHMEEMITMDKTGVTPIAQARLKRMTHYIEKNYSNKLTLENIAGAASVSKSEALRCFKEGVCTSPVDYLNKYRLRKAKELILTTNKPMSEIGGSVGFDSTSYFNRMFKREYGLTPKEQRKGLKLHI